MMEMTLAMAHLYRRFKVTLADPKETMPLIQQFIMKPSKRIELCGEIIFSFMPAKSFPNILFRISAVKCLFA